MSLLQNMKAFFVLIIFVAVVLFFTGCTDGSPAVVTEPEPTTEAETAVPEPTETPPAEIHIGPYCFLETDTSLDFSNQDVNIGELCSAASAFKDLKTITLGNTCATTDELRMLVSSFPSVEINWSVTILGTEYPNTAEVIDLSDLTEDKVPEAVAGIEKLFSLNIVQLCSGDGITEIGFESIDTIAEAVPDAEINCRFKLYGQTADWETEELRYTRVKIGDNGIPVFRAALPYLRSLKLLRLERCEIKDYESMLALKESFPDKNIVWSVLFAGYNFMTDTTLMNSPLIRDSNAHLLKYFPDVLYLDVGHNRAITNIEFVKYFPKLTTVILSITKISDITPLANCPDIEFLECFSTNVGDISCLSGLKKLEYLNLGDNKNLRDLTPLYNLENLKIVRLCQRSFDHLSRDDAKKLQEHLPDCFVSTAGGHSANSGNWRYNNDGSITERYALLKQQMRYHLTWQDRQTNSPSAEEQTDN